MYLFAFTRINNNEFYNGRNNNEQGAYAIFIEQSCQS